MPEFFKALDFFNFISLEISARESARVGLYIHPLSARPHLAEKVYTVTLSEIYFLVTHAATALTADLSPSRSAAALQFTRTSRDLAAPPYKLNVTMSL